MEDASEQELNVGEAGISAVSVKLRGLPFKALEQDISEFFDGFNVQRALLKRYPDGRPNGEVMRVILSTAVTNSAVQFNQRHCLCLVPCMHCDVGLNAYVGDKVPNGYQVCACPSCGWSS